MYADFVPSIEKMTSFPDNNPVNKPSQETQWLKSSSYKESKASSTSKRTKRSCSLTHDVAQSYFSSIPSPSESMSVSICSRAAAGGQLGGRMLSRNMWGGQRPSIWPARTQPGPSRRMARKENGPTYTNPDGTPKYEAAFASDWP